MSTIQFKELKTVNALSVPVGMRVARIIKKKGETSLAAFVPALSAEFISGFIAKPDVTEWLRGKLEEVQDRILRPYATGENATASVDAISEEAMLIAIAQEKESGRLSKAGIEAWFKADMLPRLTATLLKKGLKDTQIVEAAKMFNDGFCILAGKEPSMKTALKAQLEKALLLFEDDYNNRVAEMIATKLVDIQEAKVVEDVL